MNSKFAFCPLIHLPYNCNIFGWLGLWREWNQLNCRLCVYVLALSDVNVSLFMQMLFRKSLSFVPFHSFTLLHIFSRSRAFNIPPNQRNSHLIDYLGLRAIRLKGNQIAYAHYPERNLHQTRHTRTHTPTLEARYLRVKFCAEFFCVCVYSFRQHIVMWWKWKVVVWIGRQFVNQFKIDGSIRILYHLQWYLFPLLSPLTSYYAVSVRIYSIVWILHIDHNASICC